jgi:hypothetical protein
MQRLCAAHLRRGSPYQVGLGFYAFLRFHVDSMRFRKWGVGEAPEASPCRTSIVSPPAKSIDMPPEELNPVGPSSGTVPVSQPPAPVTQPPVVPTPPAATR